MTVIPESARAILDSDSLIHLATIDPDGSPQVSIVWAGLDRDEIVTAHLFPQRKLRNLARDPRVTLSIETDRLDERGLREYLVVHGRARIVEGGAPEWLQHLAHTYLSPDAKFPPMPGPPSGWRLFITAERFGGVGPWAGSY